MNVLVKVRDGLAEVTGDLSVGWMLDADADRQCICFGDGTVLSVDAARNSIGVLSSGSAVLRWMRNDEYKLTGELQMVGDLRWAALSDFVCLG